MNAVARIHRTRNSLIDLDQVLNVKGFDLDRILEHEPDFLKNGGHKHDTKHKHEHDGHDHTEHDHDHQHDEHDHSHCDHEHGQCEHEHEHANEGARTPWNCTRSPTTTTTSR